MTNFVNMFDSIKIWMPEEKAGARDVLAQTPGYLDKYETIHKGTLTHYRGILKNLSIYVSETGVSIRGSLAKYYLGDNIKTLSRSDTEQAVNCLSDELHLYMQKADIKGLEFGQNFIMKYKPEIYYNYLGESRYFDRFTKPNSLYYENSRRLKKFYNKLLEAKSDDVNIPEKLKDSNLLRYEIKYINRLEEQLKEPEITAKTLFKEQFYIKLVERYVSSYKSIYKIPKSPLNLDKMNTCSDWWNQKALQQVQEDGFNETMQEIEEMRARDTFNRSESYSRLKKQIRERLDKYKSDDSTPLIEELDSKISAVKRYCR